MADHTLRLLQAGMLTTVQDLGRHGHARYGVAPGGALDRAALTLGNRLLGNDPGAAGLEITLIGPAVEFLTPTVITLTGADLGASLNGFPAPCWHPVAVAAGDELTFDPARASGAGARAYLCIAGGIDVPVVLGSRSTDLVGGFGGLAGRPLRQGDELAAGEAALERDAILERRLAEAPPRHDASTPLRVVLGPQVDRFTAEGIASFLRGPYTVTGKSNRQGIRLAGPVIMHSRGPDLVSEGIAHGAIQVPGDGQPIVLLAARQTVGGYVKIATVIGADMDRLAQARPGTALQFTEVGVSEARTAFLSYLAALGSESVIAGAARPRPRAMDGLRMVRGDESITHAGGDWDPAGVVRVLEAVERTGVRRFRLHVESAGISLEVEREQADEEPGAELAPTPIGGEAGRGALVTAPLIGVFYRRSAPDQPPLVEPGQQVVAGQALCVLEVMKTYHEVTAPVAGTVGAFLVEDGHFVEYGQPLCRLTP